MTLSPIQEPTVNPDEPLPIDRSARGAVSVTPVPKIALLTGGSDKPYVFGLATTLAKQRVFMDLIGSDALDCPEFHSSPEIAFLNLRTVQPAKASVTDKIRNVCAYYGRLLRYAITAEPKIFHILWNNKFEFFDRIALTLFYKLLGKKVVLTAHNINAGKRDSNDSWANRFSLNIQYRFAHHIFVHTQRMKAELLEDFDVREENVTIIPFGINNAVPDTSLTPADAKRRLGVDKSDRTILFFGNIGPYKGLEYLIAAFKKISADSDGYRLLIAGKPRRGSEKYVEDICRSIKAEIADGRIIARVEHVPDEETELYFKAADVFALPYTFISQSGVIFLGYSFGLPAIATDVGSMAEEVDVGETGLICPSRDSAALADAIEKYFETDMYKSLDARRDFIRNRASSRHSWEVAGQMTSVVYGALAAKGNKG